MKDAVVLVLVAATLVWRVALSAVLWSQRRRVTRVVGRSVEFVPSDDQPTHPRQLPPRSDEVTPSGVDGGTQIPPCPT